MVIAIVVIGLGWFETKSRSLFESMDCLGHLTSAHVDLKDCSTKNRPASWSGNLCERGCGQNLSGATTWSTKPQASFQGAGLSMSMLLLHFGPFDLLYSPFPGTSSP